MNSLWWRLVRFGFRLLYNELAWTYDLVSSMVSLGQWRSWQQAGISHLGAQPGQTVLELAHGTGNLQIDLLTAGFRSVGLDVSRNMGRLAQHKLRQRGLLPSLVRGTAFQLPFASQSYDAAISTFPTDFFIQPKTLAEMRRVLKPGGRFVIVINGLLTSRRISARILEWLYRVTGQRGPWPGEPQKRFENAGFLYQYIIEEQARSQVILILATLPPKEAVS